MPAAYAAPTLTLARGGRMRARHPHRDAIGQVADRASRSVGEPDIIQAHGGEPMKYALIAARRSGRRGRVSEDRSRARVDRRGLRASGPRDVDAHVRTRWWRWRRRCDRRRSDTSAVPADRVVTIPRAVDAERCPRSKGPCGDAAVAGHRPRGAGHALARGAHVGEGSDGAPRRLASGSSGLPETSTSGRGGAPSVRGGAAASAAGDRPSVTRLMGTPDDVGDLLAVSDVLLLASRCEGMPGCLIEAGMAGAPRWRPTRWRRVPEVVLDGVTGRWWPRETWTRSPRRSSRLLRDDTARATMGAEARERCREALRHPSRRRTTYVALYEEVAG